MGQKVHPYGLRLGIIKPWQARWYGDKKSYAALLHEDIQLRRHIKRRFHQAGVSGVEIERAANTVRITVHTARPGMVIGKQGAEVERLRQQLEQMTGKEVRVNVVEVERPDLDAQLVAENVAFQLERRIAFRRAMRQAIQRAMRLGAKGARIAISGRIAGAEIARYEWATEGSVPLTTLRADIDYGFAEAKTTYGNIGIKVWVYKGEVLPEAPERERAASRPDAAVGAAPQGGSAEGPGREGSV